MKIRPSEDPAVPLELQGGVDLEELIKSMKDDE
jgi:hypothetical protein